MIIKLRNKHILEIDDFQFRCCIGKYGLKKNKKGLRLEFMNLLIQQMLDTDYPRLMRNYKIVDRRINAKSQTNMFNDDANNENDEKSIEKFLNDRGSTFPKVCRDNSMSIKDGYRYAFQDINNSGARIHDNKRKNILGIKNNNVYFLSLKNFINKESFKNSLLEISKQFGFAVDLSTFDKTYDIWYNQNTILQTHDAVEQHQNGNTSIKLDVLQQAYVDAQQN